MRPFEKRLIERMGDAGWVFYWLPRLHSMSKIYAIQSPPYRKETHDMVKRIDADVINYYNRAKAELERRKNLPITNIHHIDRDKYLRELAQLNRQKDHQQTGFAKDNILNAGKQTEINLVADAFESGMKAFETGDYELGDGERLLRTYVEQDNPPVAGQRLASMYHETKRFLKQKRRDWVPAEMKYLDEFIRASRNHFKRLAIIAFHDGVEYMHILERKAIPEREGRKQARTTELSPESIVKMMDVLYFKFDKYGEMPLSREEFDRMKKLILANYDYASQIGRRHISEDVVEEYYIKPSITAIRKSAV